MEQYTPKIIEESRTHAYATMLVEFKKCPICKKLMFEGFPAYWKINKQSQMKLINAVEFGTVELDNSNIICIECQHDNKATFECCICKEHKKSSDIETSIGYPAEHLCESCYASVPAKEWANKIEELAEIHKYDFE